MVGVKRPGLGLGSAQAPKPNSNNPVLGQECELGWAMAQHEKNQAVGRHNPLTMLTWLGQNDTNQRMGRAGPRSPWPAIYIKLFKHNNNQKRYVGRPVCGTAQHGWTGPSPSLHPYGPRLARMRVAESGTHYQNSKQSDLMVREMTNDKAVQKTNGLAQQIYDWG